MLTSLKKHKIQTLKYIVLSRWFLHLGILLLGLIQKIIGVAQFDPKIFLLLGLTYGYNFIYFLILRRDISKISDRTIYIISLLQVIIDQILFTVIIYSTGGIESLSFLFYFITVFMAILLFNEIEIIALTLLSGFMYIVVIVLEYHEIIPHHARYVTDPGFFQNIAVTVHNSATVILIIVFTAFFAAFIGRLIRSREEALKAETEKVNITLNNLIDGVIALDPHGKIILINPPAASFLNISFKKVLNKKFHVDLLPDNFKAVSDFVLDSFAHGRDNATEITVKQRKEELVFKINFLTLFAGQGDIRGYVVIIRNITREKELDRLKSDFISIAAHQLRTPLSTIKWLFKMLLDGDAGKLNAKQTDLLTKGLQRNNDVIEIVNNLLDVSEIEEGRLPFKEEYCSIIDIFEEIYKSSQYNAQRNEVNLIFNKPSHPIPLIKTDLQKIRIAIQNLVDNAIKYTPAKGNVILSLELDNQSIVIKVKDSGIGIPADEQNNIFTKFFRARTAISQEPTGSGLGLYIVKNIINKQGGKIWFESAEDQGATFFIELPLNDK